MKRVWLFEEAEQDLDAIWLFITTGSGIVGVALIVGLGRAQGVRLRDRLHGVALMTGNSSIVHSDPEILGGIPVFVGTRVPLRNLIDYLEGNYSLDEFLDSFPTVSREQAVAALESAHDAVSALAYSDRCHRA